MSQKGDSFELRISTQVSVQYARDEATCQPEMFDYLNVSAMLLAD